MNNQWDYNGYGGITLNGIEHCSHCAKMPERACCEDHDDEDKDDTVINKPCTCCRSEGCTEWYSKTFGSK